MATRCEALTKMGVQCRRNATRDGRCGVHVRIEARAEVGPRRYFTPQDLAHVNSNNSVHILAGLANLNRIRTLEHVRDFLASNILDRVVTLFLDNRSVHIRDNACWVLTNLASVAEDRTGAEAILGSRPNMLEILHERMITEGNPHLLGNILWCLANIASSGGDLARRIVDEDFHTIAGDIFSNPRQNTNLRKNAAFLVRVLVHVMTREEALGSLAQVEEIPPAILMDTNVLGDLLWTIYELCGKTGTLGGITPGFLTDMLYQTSARFISPALRAIGDICAGNDRPLINRFLGVNLLPALYGILQRPVFTRDVLWIFSNLAVDPEGAQALLETSGLLFDIGLLAHTHQDAVWTLSNLATRGSKEVVVKLVRCGIPVVLVEVLQGDDVTQLVRDLCLEGIAGVLTKYPMGGGALVAPRVGVIRAHAGNHHADRILEFLGRAGVAGAEEEPAPAEPVYTPSPAVPVALGRLADSSGRNELRAHVGDLVFTAQDIAHLLGRGVIFHRDGSISERV